MSPLDAELEPLEPLLVADLFAPLGEALLTLLRSLDAESWQRPTICAAWNVKDVAAHLLDTGLRRLSCERDRHTLPPPETAIASYGDLVGFLNLLNAQWTTAARRISPRLLTELLGFVEERLARHLESLDPWGEALFPVAWAGEDSSRAWFDVARELTERWLHQQQIRLAVGASPLDDPRFSAPVLETFLYALPHRYRALDAAPGTRVTVRIAGQKLYLYTLLRAEHGWRLLRGWKGGAEVQVAIAEDATWQLFTKGLPGDEARQRARITGRLELAAPFFQVLAVMA